MREGAGPGDPDAAEGFEGGDIDVHRLPRWSATDRENPEHKRKKTESPALEKRQGRGTLTSKQRPGHPSHPKVQIHSKAGPPVLGQCLLPLRLI
jgi:hypothetical protein